MHWLRRYVNYKPKHTFYCCAPQMPKDAFSESAALVTDAIKADILAMVKAGE